MNFSILQTIDPALDQFIQETLRKVFDVAVVGGSDISKIKRQLGDAALFKKYDYVFAENGLIAYKDGKQLPSEVNTFKIINQYNTLICIYDLIKYYRSNTILTKIVQFKK